MRYSHLINEIIPSLVLETLDTHDSPPTGYNDVSQSNDLGEGESF